MKVVTQDCQIQDTFAMLLEITDEQLEYIKNNPFTIEAMQEFMKSKGDNAHIVQLTIKDDCSIFRCINTLLERYKTVSWFNQENKFFIKGA